MRSSTLAVLIPVLLLGIAARAGAQQYPPAIDSARARVGAPMAKPTATDPALAAAQRAAEAWLALVDRAQYAASWDSAATVFQRAGTPQQWATAVKQVRGQVGPLNGRTVQRSQLTNTLPNVPPGEYAIFLFRSVAGAGKAIGETVIMQRDGARGWRLAAYVVRPE